MHASGEARYARSNVGCGMPEVETAPQDPVEKLLESKWPDHRYSPYATAGGLPLPPSLPQSYLNRYAWEPSRGASGSAPPLPARPDPCWAAEQRDGLEMEELGRPRKRVGAPIPWLPRNLMWELAMEREWLNCESWLLARSSIFRGVRDRVGGFNKRRAEIVPASWAIRTEGRPTAEQLAAKAAGKPKQGRASSKTDAPKSKPSLSFAAPGLASDDAVNRAAEMVAGLAVHSRSGLAHRGGKPGMPLAEALDEGRQVVAGLKDDDELASAEPQVANAVWGLRKVMTDSRNKRSGGASGSGATGTSADAGAGNGNGSGVVNSRDEGEDDVVCNVCFDGKSSPKNQVVMCDRCDIAVHAACYGVAEIPDGPWLCDVCREAKRAQHLSGGGPVGKARAAAEVLLARCCLCESRGGALKLTADGRYVHPICAITSQGVWIDDFSEMSGIVAHSSASGTVRRARLASSGQARSFARYGFRCRSPGHVLRLLNASHSAQADPAALSQHVSGACISTDEMVAALNSPIWTYACGVLLGAGGKKAVEEVLAPDDHEMHRDAKDMKQRAIAYAIAPPALPTQRMLTG